MIIKVIPSGPFSTNAYVVASPRTKECAVIDPAPESASKIFSIINENQWTPVKILLTHSHWDHTAETAAIKKKYQCPVLIHQLDAPNLIKPGSDGLPCWIPIEGVQPDSYLKEGDEFQVGDLTFQVIETPGHTPGGICFYCPAEKVLFSGDTLFQSSIGNLSFPTARPNLMWPSLDKLAALPGDTKVYPGHGPDTTIAAESWLPNARKIFGD